MSNYYKDIERQLEPFRDKVFYHGLTEAEVLAIEQKIGKIFPIHFREFLKTFGVRQDFIFGLISREGDFENNTKYLPEHIKTSYIVIGDNGGEDYWLINTLNKDDTDIYEWQHWNDGEVVKLGYNFNELIQRNISNLSDPSIELQSNAQKSWCVQFSIPTNSEHKIYETVPLTEVQNWVLKEVSPAKVHCYETKAKLYGKTIKLKRQEYGGWETPIYYFDLREPVSEFDKQSTIKEIDTRLKAIFPKYKLVDYGILSLPEEADN